MHFMQRQFLAFGLTAAVALTAPLARAANTEARLVFSHETTRPGDSVVAGIELTMNPGWHTYWRYGGGSGAAGQVERKLPASIKAGEIQWPVPEKFIFSGETNFVYHTNVVLLVPLKIASDAPAGPV